MFSDMGRSGVRWPGNTSAPPPVTSRASFRIATACVDSGTACSRFIFMRLAGMRHTPASRSISAHAAWRSSPGRTKTCGARRSAHLVTGWPLKSSMARKRAPTAAGSMIAAWWRDLGGDQRALQVGGDVVLRAGRGDGVAEDAARER